MDIIAQELIKLRDDIAAIQLHCEGAYNEVKKELKLKEIALEKLYEHNVRLVKEKNNCEDK